MKLYEQGFGVLGMETEEMTSSLLCIPGIKGYITQKRY